MRLLILGGTVFLGRHVVDAALRRGHTVTIYTRGRHGSAPGGVEHVIGDRADLAPLAGRSWDAAIDTSGYDPAQVAASTKLDAPGGRRRPRGADRRPARQRLPPALVGAAVPRGQARAGRGGALMELPLWLPVRHAGTWDIGTERAQAAGLWTRPPAETVADTWKWLQTGGESELDGWRAEHRPPRMSAEREEALIRLL